MAALFRVRTGAALLLTCLLWAGCGRSPAAREAAFVEKAKRYMTQKDYGRAAIELQNATKLNAKDAQAWYQLGLTYLGMNNVAGAVQALRRATQLDPHLAAAQLRLSELEVRSREPAVLKDALQRLDQVLTADANDPEALDTIATAELKLGKPEDALKHLQQALSNFPGHVRSAATLAATQFAKRDFEGAEATLKKAQAAAPKSTEASLALANLYVLENKKFEAETELKHALQLTPASESALLMMGALLTAEGRIDEADRTYRTLAAIPHTTLNYVHAAFLLQQRKFTEAIAEFEKLAAQTPKDRAPKLRLISADIAAGRATEATSHLDQMLKSNPKDTDALLMRSRIDLALGRAMDAERDIQQVLHFKPDSADAHFGMARVDAILGRHGSRKQELAQVIQLAPNLIGPRVDLARLLIQEGQPESALQTMDEAPAGLKRSATFVAGRNWALLALNREKEAAEGVEQGLQLQRTPDLLVQSGLLKLIKKDYAGAQSDAEAAQALNPAHPGALNLAVQSCLARKQTAAAIEIVRKTAARNEKSPMSQVMAGQWFRNLAQPGEARARFAAAKALNPNFSQSDTASAALDMAEGKLDSARSTLNQLLKRQPDSESGHLLLAQIEFSSKNQGAALEQYRAAAELNPENAYALNATAYLMAATEPDKALKLAERALELAPKSAQVQDTLGWIYYRKGSFVRAVDYLKLAVASAPTPVHQFHLAMTYLKTGDRTQGQELLSQALAKDPNLPKTEVGW
jgi:tetratricopeptide (TPR) repeat protein